LICKHFHETLRFCKVRKISDFRGFPFSKPAKILTVENKISNDINDLRDANANNNTLHLENF